MLSEKVSSQVVKRESTATIPRRKSSQKSGHYYSLQGIRRKKINRRQGYRSPWDALHHIKTAAQKMTKLAGKVQK